MAGLHSAGVALLKLQLETTLVESPRGGTAFGGRRPVAVAAGNPFGEHIYLKLV